MDARAEFSADSAQPKGFAGTFPGSLQAEPDSQYKGANSIASRRFRL